jgi:flagellin-like hook-associated protein FlgL
MTIDGVGARTSYLGTSLLNLKSQMDTLQQQLATGKVANTYAGQGVDRGFAVGLRAQLSSIASYSDTATNVNTRIGVINLSLQGMVDLGTEVKTAANNASTVVGPTGQSSGQVTAQTSFSTMISMLNVQSGDRYLFSGRATDTPATASADDILNGTGAQAGLKQLIAERKQADLGASGLGRLVIDSPTPTSVSMAEDTAGSPFGFKIASVSSSLTGATVSGPAGTPPSVSVDLGATNPNEGDTVKFNLTLPDGTSESVELTATTADPPPAGSFTIGADTTATAANLGAALNTSVGTLANTSLVAASAMAASDNFFDSPPMRVSGSPLNAATSLVAGTPANTVSWYTGEAGTDSARGTAVARIDQSITVQYGARANEDAFRTQLQNMAVFVAVTASPTDPNGAAQITALSQRVATNLTPQPGDPTVQDIQADFAGVQTSIKAASDRQTQTQSMAQTMLASIEGISDDEVATKIMALQTSLSASYQTTAMLYQTSLLKYL